MVHSLSCSDAEWERVRERADAAGLSISRYLVERAMTVELPRGAPPPRRAAPPAPRATAGAPARPVRRAPPPPLNGDDNKEAPA